jgi:tetratricopeptide (TPR) repeat protein
MTKVVQFPVSSPERFGFRPVGKRKPRPGAAGQLELFTGGRVVKLNELTPFEEALMLDQQQDPRAVAMYQEAIRQFDSPADAYCNLGIIYSNRADFARAVDSFTRCLKEAPRHFEAHYNLANVYAELGNLPLAKLHYQVAISVEPDFSNAYFNLGLVLARNQEWQAAIDTLSEYLLRVTHDEGQQARDLIRQLAPFAKPEEPPHPPEGYNETN